MRKYWPLTRPSPISARHCAAFVIAALVAALVAAMPAQARLLPQPPAAAPPPLGTDANDTGDQGKDKKVKVRKIKKKDGAETNSFGSYTGKVTGTGDILSRYETLGLDMGGQQAFGDNIDIDLGMLSFSHVDVSVPGNSALPVELRRELARGNPTNRMVGFGNWGLVVPQITFEWLQPNGLQAYPCSTGLGGPETTRVHIGGLINPPSPPWVDVYRSEFFNGLTMLTPSGERKELLINYGSPEFAGTNARLVTKDNWIVRCVAPTGGETFEATAPDGTRYTFNHRVAGGYRDHVVYRDGEQFEEVVTYINQDKFLLTRIDDVNGNWVAYEYSGSSLVQVHSNDGRSIQIAWDGDRIASVSSHGRTWTYSYGGGWSSYLSQVTLPDGGYWQFDPIDFDDGYATPGPAQCGYNVPGPFTVRHPAGATATYTFAEIINGSYLANYPFPGPYYQDRFGMDCMEYPAAVRSLAVVSKQVNVPGTGTFTSTWRYEQDRASSARPPPNRSFPRRSRRCPWRPAPSRRAR